MSYYVIVTWPESQELMEREGFEENCHLINDESGLDLYGSSAYFVDKDWLDAQCSSSKPEDDSVDPSICYGRDDLLAVAESIANEVGNIDIAEDLCEHMAKAGAEYLKYLKEGGTYSYTQY